MAISLEPEFHTRGVVLPDDRYALRRWLHNFILLCNASEKPMWNTFFSDDVAFASWLGNVASVKDWQHYIEYKQTELPDYVIRFAELTVEQRGGVWEVRGTLEEYASGLLVTQGKVTLEVLSLGDTFVFSQLAFLPGFLVKPELV